jgi:hypothetical protein
MVSMATPRKYSFYMYGNQHFTHLNTHKTMYIDDIESLKLILSGFCIGTTDTEILGINTTLARDSMQL